MNKATQTTMSTTMNEAAMSTNNGTSRKAVAFVEGLNDTVTMGVKVRQALSVQNLSALNISEVYFVQFCLCLIR